MMSEAVTAMVVTMTIDCSDIIMALMVGGGYGEW